MATDPPASGSRLRRAVIALAGAEIVVLSGFLALFAPALSSNEALSSSIAQAAMVLTAVPLVALALPALILGLKARALKTALTLALLVLPVGVVLFLFA